MSKKYEVFLHGGFKTTVYVDADSEDDAIEQAHIEVGLDNVFDHKVKEIKPTREELIDVLARSTDKVEIKAILKYLKEEEDE